MVGSVVERCWYGKEPAVVKRGDGNGHQEE